MYVNAIKHMVNIRGGLGKVRLSNSGLATAAYWLVDVTYTYPMSLDDNF